MPRNRKCPSHRSSMFGVTTSAVSVFDCPISFNPGYLARGPLAKFRSLPIRESSFLGLTNSFRAPLFHYFVPDSVKYAEGQSKSNSENPAEVPHGVNLRISMNR